ncbi:MAG: SdpI family protein [Candidatus Woesearchaeota archaeon]
MKAVYIISVIIIIISIITAVYFYQYMPDRMAIHWNSRGDVDDYTSKFLGLFLIPIISVVCFLLFIFIPKLDPLKKNFKKFEDYYDFFIFVFLLFLLYLFILTIMWNLGYYFNMMSMIIPSFALLFYCIGVLIHHAKQNWFVGIRTPWTLSNEEVWNKTHRVGGILFRIVAFISLFGLLFPRYAFIIFILLVIFVIIFIMIYSYIEYRKTETLKQKKMRKIIK